MRRFLAAFGKFAFCAALVSVLALSAMAQVALRDAIDADNDNKADFIIFRPSDSNWYTLTSGGAIRIQSFGVANTDFMVPGDYDADGIGDIAVWRETTGEWYRIFSTTQTYSVSLWGVPGDEPVARDYDGDHKTDMAVVRRSGGVMTWYLFLSANNGIVTRVFGNPTDFTAPGDYNGDGKYDFAVQRPGATPTSAATWYVQTDVSFDTYTFGQSNDLVVPGDYDGDGKTDIAVIREGTTPTSNLQWIIRRSSDGGTTGPVEWGVTGTDLNVQNDYDGDGKTDYAVWRNTDGKFYVFHSNSAISIVHWGVPNDFPVAGYDTH